MKFHQTPLHGAYSIELEPHADARGSFARTFCVREFAQHGLEAAFVQHSSSTSHAKGTLRGMHFQRAPHAETKLLRCVRGAIYDVIVDLRPDSPTFCKWASFELSAQNGRELYIPAGFAHGFQTLTDDVELHYLISAFYEASAAGGYRYDDPTFAIDWPLPVAVVADKDLAWPKFVRRA